MLVIEHNPYSNIQKGGCDMIVYVITSVKNNNIESPCVYADERSCDHEFMNKLIHNTVFTLDRPDCLMPICQNMTINDIRNNCEAAANYCIENKLSIEEIANFLTICLNSNVTNQNRNKYITEVKKKDDTFSFEVYDKTNNGKTLRLAIHKSLTNVIRICENSGKFEFIHQSDNIPYKGDSVYFDNAEACEKEAIESVFKHLWYDSNIEDKITDYWFNILNANDSIESTLNFGKAFEFSIKNGATMDNLTKWVTNAGLTIIETGNPVITAQIKTDYDGIKGRNCYNFFYCNKSDKTKLDKNYFSLIIDTLPLPPIIT